jgi:PTS system maltose and glucose-specific IIC component
MPYGIRARNNAKGSNKNTLILYPFLNHSWLQMIFTIMSMAGNIVFANLPLLFAIGISIGLARSDKGTAALAAVLSYLVMNATINALLIITGKLAKSNLAEVGQGTILGIQTLQTGVLGGVIVGLLATFLHNRYNKKELPQFLGFFSGSRFVPIITSFSSIFLGIFMFLTWPYIQSCIAKIGSIVNATGYIGTFFYGLCLKLLGPLGLHHIFYMPFWTTAVGGSMVVNGRLVEGTQNIFFAQLADPNVKEFYFGTSRFMAGKFITMMFGLPGAALALYHTAKKENKKKVLGLLFSAALTSFLTGITEPLEFSFLFVAPLLFVVHSVLWGLAFMTAHIFHITIGQTFSGGFIDFFLFGILQGNAKTHWIMVPIVGAAFFVIYYGVFRFLIVKFNFKTPGREDESIEENNENVIGNLERANAILNALGGKANIQEVDCCATRLRVTVNNSQNVSESLLKQTGAKGVIVKGNGVQVIYGPHVTIIKNEIEDLLGG